MTTHAQEQTETAAEAFGEFIKDHLGLIPHLSPSELFAYGFNRGFMAGNDYGKAADRSQLQHVFTPEYLAERDNVAQYGHEDAQTYREVPEDFALEPSRNQADGIYS